MPYICTVPLLYVSMLMSLILRQIKDFIYTVHTEVVKLQTLLSEMCFYYILGRVLTNPQIPPGPSASRRSQRSLQFTLVNGCYSTRRAVLRLRSVPEASRRWALLKIGCKSIFDARRCIAPGRKWTGQSIQSIPKITTLCRPYPSVVFQVGGEMPAFSSGLQALCKLYIE